MKRTYEGVFEDLWILCVILHTIALKAAAAATARSLRNLEEVKVIQECALHGFERVPVSTLASGQRP